jgi:hypothetical protein
VKRTLSLGLAVVLSACVNAETTLRNNATGQTAHCSGTGFGVIGSAVTYSEYLKCIDFYKSAGFSSGAVAPPGQPGPAPAATAGGSAGTAAPTAAVILQSKDRWFELRLPNGWSSTDLPPSPANAQIFARAGSGSAFLLTDDDHKDIQDLRAFGDLTDKAMTAKLSSPQSWPVQSATINDHRAVRFEIAGTISGVRLHYLVTIVETGNRVATLTAWTMESKFAEGHEELASLAGGLREVPR